MSDAPRIGPGDQPQPWVMNRPIRSGRTEADFDTSGGTLRLVERAQAGDRDAFAALVRSRLERLLRLSISILGNEADARDAVQDSCLRAWRELPRLRDADRFEAWLWRITINSCRTSLRRRRRVAVQEIDVEDASFDVDPMERGRPFADEVTIRDAIRRAFRRLDPDTRTILVLHYVDERPVTEVAQLLGIAEGTAKSRLFAARKRLARALEVER